jgi:hypothetical protein
LLTGVVLLALGVTASYGGLTRITAEPPLQEVSGTLAGQPAFDCGATVPKVGIVLDTPPARQGNAPATTLPAAHANAFSARFGAWACDAPARTQLEALAGHAPVTLWVVSEYDGYAIWRAQSGGTLLAAPEEMHTAYRHDGHLPVIVGLGFCLIGMFWLWRGVRMRRGAFVALRVAR